MENVWSKDHPRKIQKRIHAWLQGIGSTAAIIGMFFEVAYSIKHNEFHFKTNHSKIGLAAGILTLIGMFNGIGAFWSVELRQYVRPVYLKLAHNLTGLSAFILGKKNTFLKLVSVLQRVTHHSFNLKYYLFRQE